jgi:hypothetical protein
MVGGTYYAATGTIPGAVVLASFPYALLCTTVLMGKHIDKIAWDAPDGTHTLPVLMGEGAARRLTQAMFVAFYVSIFALVIARVLPVASVLVVLSWPVLRRTFDAYSRPKPDVSPIPNPVWPLWFAAMSFLVTRRAVCSCAFLVGADPLRLVIRRTLRRTTRTGGAAFASTMQDFPADVTGRAAAPRDERLRRYRGHGPRRSPPLHVRDDRRNAGRLATPYAPPAGGRAAPARSGNLRRNTWRRTSRPSMGAVPQYVEHPPVPWAACLRDLHGEDKVARRRFARPALARSFRAVTSVECFVIGVTAMHRPSVPDRPIVRYPNCFAARSLPILRGPRSTKSGRRG